MDSAPVSAVPTSPATVTLRDYFAAQMLAYCAEVTATPSDAVRRAYLYADIMLKVREQ